MQVIKREDGTYEVITGNLAGLIIENTGHGSINYSTANSIDGKWEATEEDLINLSALFATLAYGIKKDGNARQALEELSAAGVLGRLR